MAPSIANRAIGFMCFLCSLFIKGGYSDLTKHFRLAHAMQTTGQSKKPVRCGQGECQLKFRSFAKLRYHLLNFHSQTFQNTQGTNDEIREERHNNFDFAHEDVNMSDIEADLSSFSNLPSNIGTNSNNDKMTKSFARFFLGLRAQHNVTHVALDYIASQLPKLLREVSHQSDSKESLVTSAEKSIKKLDSQKKRTNFYQKHFDFNEPISKCVRNNSEQQEVRVTARGLRQPKTETFQYISIRKTLSSLFSNLKFWAKYFSELPSVDGFIRSHRDSNHFKKHPLFAQNNFALRLQLFFDEVEIVNPLGSKTKKHECGMFCFTILNLPPAENSMLTSIHPFAICNSKFLKDSEFRFIIDEFMKEVRLLESDEGMLLDVSHNPGFRIRGAIVSHCADTKGAHEIFGFAGPSSAKFCRLCLISRSEIMSKNKVNNLEMRTKANYSAAIEDVEQFGHDRISLTGVKFNSPLNDCKFFHVANHFILDSMHDFLEGVIPFIIKLCFREFVIDGSYNFSASTLNDRLKRFQYSYYDSSNKPSPSFNTAQLRQSGNYKTKQRAAQNWCLMRMLPLLIGDLIPEGDEFFSLILLLLQIMDIIFSPTVSTEHTVILENLIERIYVKFALLFPLVSPINKFHHMIHYPQSIRNYGPPIRFWCMRYEAYHNIVKRVAHVNCNFINITKSIANHLQTIACHALLTDSIFHSEEPEFGPHIREPYDFQEHAVSMDPIFKVDDSAITFRFMKLKGWHYFPGSIVVLKPSYQTRDNYPEFAKIENIITQNNEIFVRVTIFKTVRFSEHFHAFEVQEEPGILRRILSFHSLPHIEPLWLLKNFETEDMSCYVCPRHWV